MEEAKEPDVYPLMDLEVTQYEKGRSSAETPHMTSADLLVTLQCAAGPVALVVAAY